MRQPKKSTHRERAGMRTVTIDGLDWQYSVGRGSLGIIDPREDKRHNIHQYDLFLVADGTWVYPGCYNDVETVKPSTVCTYIKRAFLGTEPLLDFTASFWHPVVANVVSSLGDEEVTRRVKEHDTRYFLRPATGKMSEYGQFTGTNPRPWGVSPSTHKVYIFVRDVNQ